MKNESKSQICKICNKSFKSITPSHLKKHNYTLKEYKELYDKNDEHRNKCQYYHEYTKHQCKERISSHDKEYCILHSKQDNKDADLFNKTLNQILNSCKKKTDKTNYSDTHYDAIYTGEIHLEGIIFPKDLEIYNKKFENKVFFNDCKFNGYTNFWNLTFEETVYFKHCSFHDVSFRVTSFQKSLSFSNSKFHASARFVKTKFNTTEDYIFFINVQFDNPRQVLFRENDFSRVLFRHTDLRNVNMELIRWPIKSWISGNRRYLREEFYYSNEAKYELRYRNIKELQNEIEQKIEKESDREVLITKLNNLRYENKIFSTKKEFLTYLADKLTSKEFDNYHQLILKFAFDNRLNGTRISYQQLKHNFEERKSFDEAGDFYYGEMECLRKSNPFSRYFPLSTINLFRLSSGYGQRYIQSGIVLISLLFLFVLLHMFNGLEPSKNNKDFIRINYNIKGVSYSNEMMFTDFYGTTIYCLEVLIREPENDRIFRPLNTKGDIINLVFIILIYIQLIFFTLAMKRRFKR